MRSSAQWREMPSEFGPWATVYGRFRVWRDAGVFTALLEGLIAEAARAGTPPSLSGMDGSLERSRARPPHPVRMREMTEADIDAVPAVRVRGRQAAYRGLMPQAYLDAMSVAADAERRRSWFGRRSPEVSDLVAERDGDVVGWACVGPARDPDIAPGAEELPAPPPTAGELLALYVAP